MLEKEISSEKIQHLAQQLKVLSEPNRLAILELLIQGTQCNCVLGDALQMAPNLISHHLSVLRDAGLVNVERDILDGRWIYYSINTQAVQELAAAFGAFFNPERIQHRQASCGPRPASAIHD
jgi:ArsR family transcriptional regulator, arsenate/arsenite/antimonite-responsive transcriptional repressor